jgi:D-alanine-D-alanine ligase
VVASRNLAEGEVIMRFEGRPHNLVTRDWVEANWSAVEKQWFRAYAWPLSDQVWVTWPEDPEEWRPMNHSCDPNAWLDGLNLVARRPIASDEEIRIDYATYGNNILAPFECTCGAENCRGRVAEDDHLKPFLDRYEHHISDFVKQKRREAGL